ncbi:hypothetical protein M9458_009636, partial [Cirrhinus mrigala]
GTELGHTTGRRDDHPDNATVRGHAGCGILSRSCGRCLARDAAGGNCYHGTQQ